MKALVVYDTLHGNTRAIAHAISEGLAATCEVQVMPAAEAAPFPADSALLVIGGPTHGRGMSPAMKVLMGTLGRGTLTGVAAATFDTRFKMPQWLAGSAADVIATRLAAAGCVMVTPPESFFVKFGEKGPLLAGEEQRAQAWGATLAAATTPAPVAV